MGLYNPVLGNIPQPDINSNQVPFILPKDNYGAQVITPQLNNPYIISLEASTSGGALVTDTETITRPIVLTGIIIQRIFYISTGASNSCAYEIYINGIKVISFDDYLEQNIDVTRNNDTFIPIEHYLYPSNSIFKITIQRGGTANGVGRFNVSFIGYTNPKL